MPLRSLPIAERRPVIERSVSAGLCVRAEFETARPLSRWPERMALRSWPSSPVGEDPRAKRPYYFAESVYSRSPRYNNRVPDGVLREVRSLRGHGVGAAPGCRQTYSDVTDVGERIAG